MARDGRIGSGARVAVAAATALVLAVTAHASAPPAQTPGGTGFLGADGGAPLYLEPPPDALAAAPPPEYPSPASPRGSGAGAGPVGAGGIPATVLTAYQRAADRIAGSDPGCALPVALLAAIGRVESHHARGGAVDRDGRALSPIIGLRLDGAGPVARITDTDGGRLDGDRAFDRAVGPMQFIPATWARWGADGSGDGTRDPQNVHDAALAAGHYLCAGDRRLSRSGDLRAAILSYNGSGEYLRVVLGWMDVYQRGARPVDDVRGRGAVPLAVSPVAVHAPHEPAPAPAPQAAAPNGAPPARPQGRPDAAPAPGPAQSPRPAAEAVPGADATPTGRVGVGPVPPSVPAQPSQAPLLGSGSAPAPTTPSGQATKRSSESSSSSSISTSSSEPPPSSEPRPSSPPPSSSPPSSSQPPPTTPPPTTPPPTTPPPVPETCEPVRRVVDPGTGAVQGLPEPVCLSATDQQRIRDEGGTVADGSVTGVPMTNPVLRSVLGL